MKMQKETSAWLKGAKTEQAHIGQINDPRFTRGTDYQ